MMNDDFDADKTELPLALQPFLTDILDAAADGITAQDKSGSLIYANATAAKMLGYPSPHELLAAPIQEVVNRFEIFDEFGEAFPLNRLPGRLVLDGAESPALTLRFRVKATNAEHWSTVQSSPIYGKRGTVEFAVNTFHDITHLKATEAKQLFLAEASLILTSSLDYETTLANVTRLMTPTIADWSSVDLVDEKGLLQRVAVSHVDPEKIAWAYQLREEYPIDMNAKTGLTNVIRVGKSEFYPEIPDEMLVAGAQNPKHLQLMRNVGFRSAIIVPLGAHGKIFGALTLVTTTDSGRLFNQFDLLMAEDLGRTAGLAIENARSYHQTQVDREHLRVTLTSIGDAVLAVDAEANVTFLNTVAENLTGWTHEEAIGHSISEVFQIINEHSRKPVANPIAKVIETGLIVGLANHTLLISRDGREIPIEDSAAPIRSVDAAINGAVLVFKDVTEARAIQAALESARNQAELAVERLSRLQDLTSALSGAATVRQIAHICISRSLASLDADMGVIALLSPDGSVLETIESYGNSPAAQYFESLPLDSSLPLVDTVKTGRAIWLESKANFQQLYPSLFANKSKPFKSQSFASLPLHIEDRVIGSIGFNFPSPQSFDEMERSFMFALAHQCAQALERARLYEVEMQAREAAEQASQLKMQFLAMISHELRTPLTTIKELKTNLLTKDIKEQQKSFFAALDQETYKLSHLVDQLLDLSLLQSGTLRIEPVPQPVENIIKAANPQLEALTEQHQLLIHIAKNLPPVLADTQRLAQVMINLVGNAVKFSPLNTYITIVVSELGDRVQIDVSDEGEGISTEQQMTVFEAFRQGERKVSNQSQGAGLGLAICKAIVEAHNGEIWVQDKIIGTTISFNLPYRKSTPKK